METIEEHTKSDSDCSVNEVSPPSKPVVKTRICLVGDVNNDKEAVDAALSFNVHLTSSDSGLELTNDPEWDTHFVINDFNTPAYEEIHRHKQRILGPPALKQAASLQDGLPQNLRPLYNFSMRGVITCFTGIRQKEELTNLVNLIHSMGGTIRKEMTSKITHLISFHSIGDKYRYAKTFRLTVVRPSWVYAAWEQRNDASFVATSELFTSAHVVRPFEGLKICFFGFPSDEQEHMTDVLNSNGGLATILDDPECSHVVVDEHTVQAKPEPKSSRCHIVKSDWFWYTIQNGYAHEADFFYGDFLESIVCTPNTDRSDSLPLSFNNKRKRKRFSQRLQLEGTPLGSGKRRSSVSDAGLLSLSSSFFDCTTSPEKLEITAGETSTSESQTTTMRFNYFNDFFTTESNYVGILDTVFKLFKTPLEDLADTNDPLLNKSEIKSIFGNFDPIYEVHQRMLDRLRALKSHWTEECLVGDIILDFQDDLIKAYPPYVNFFEQMKEALQYCDEHYPRFHAFLKINQTKPECGRQPLRDLMIRPVQRLPSISLLLNEILKHTNKNCPDHGRLQEALKAIKEVMTYINEDKKKTESHMAIFDAFNDIEGCPADLISSNRHFISKCEVTELSDSLSGRGDCLALYLFTDTIELCKKRSRGFNTAKSPCTAKCYKHLKLVSLNTIRFVIDITDSPKAFAILFRQEKDKVQSFAITDEETEKKIYLRQLCKQIAENACRTDADKILLYRTSQELDIDISDAQISTLSKAFRLAAKTRLKVGRAFSFNKTPSKLKRAVSTMMTSPFGQNGVNSLTPATQLAQMRLASVGNIHEAEDLTDDGEQILQ